MTQFDKALEPDTPAFDRLAEAIRYTRQGRRCWIPTPDGGTRDVLDYSGLAYLSVEDLRSLDGWAVTIEAEAGEGTEEDAFVARVLIADTRYDVEIQRWSGRRSIACVRPLAT